MVTTSADYAVLRKKNTLIEILIIITVVVDEWIVDINIEFTNSSKNNVMVLIPLIVRKKYCKILVTHE